MKTFFISIAMICFVNTLYAEAGDSIFVIISSDTVHIWNTGAYENCGCLFRMDVTLSNDTIYVTEVDTASDWAYCMCNFDLCASITGLQSETYFVKVYRYMPLFYPDTLFYIGSTSFTYPGSVLAFISHSYQSDCYNITEVNENKIYPTEFKLEQSYPNPFNPSTTIRWQTPVDGRQTIKLFDVLGREIETIVDGYYEAGSHSTLYIVNSLLPSGVYFYQLKAGDCIQTKKMILTK